MGETKKVVSFPLMFRHYRKDDTNVILIYNDKSHRIVNTTGHPSIIGRQINAVSLELKMLGWNLVTSGDWTNENIQAYTSKSKDVHSISKEVSETLRAD